MTLVELMVSLVISSLIVIAAAAFLLGSSRTRDTQDAAGELQDTARFVTEIITRNIQQAGFQNHIDGSQGSIVRREGNKFDASIQEPDVRGWNNSAAGSDLDHGSHDRSTNRVNNSDTLVLRFQGLSTMVSTGTGTATVTGMQADGSMIDCRGQPVGLDDASAVTNADIASSVFEIRQSTGAEPELRCKYKNSSGNWVSEVIARGVEVLQVMYGLDTNGDFVPDLWQNAQQVDVAANQADWRKVRAIRVGMVLRSSARAGLIGGAITYQPLGAQFSQSTTTDPGSSFTAADDGRLRKVVTFTVNVRNDLQDKRDYPE